MAEPGKAQPTQQARPQAVGIACRGCGCRHMEVVYTRRKGTMVVRRRECRHCGRRTTTYEREGV